MSIQLTYHKSCYDQLCCNSCYDQLRRNSCYDELGCNHNSHWTKCYNQGTGCPIIKFTFLIYKFLSPLILLRDCSVLEIFVLISPLKKTMFKCSSMFTFRYMKHSMENIHFWSFYTPKFDDLEKLKYFKMSWIRPYIILFGIYMFSEMGNIINFCFLLV